jgi:hypothetical protein
MLPLLPSCSDRAETDDPPVARAFGETLRWSDLRRVVPLDADPRDSADLANTFINNWLRERVVLQQAESNLSESEKNFSELLKSYRNSLIIYAYEQALVEQKLDTVISEQEIQLYHDQNSRNHILRENIVQARWFKVREDDRRLLRKLEDQFRSNDPERFGELEVWLAQRGIGITETGPGWMGLDLLLTQLPLLPEHHAALMDRPGKHVFREDDASWFVEIMDLRTKDSVAPLELVREDIRAVIINQRKVRLLERMREDLYSEALERNDIEVL